MNLWIVISVSISCGMTSFSVSTKVSGLCISQVDSPFLLKLQNLIMIREGHSNSGTEHGYISDVRDHLLECHWCVLFNKKVLIYHICFLTDGMMSDCRD